MTEENGWGSLWDKSCCSWTWKRPSISTLFSLRHCSSYQWLLSSHMLCIHSFFNLMLVHPEVTPPWAHKRKGFLPTRVPNFNYLSYFKNQCKQPTRSLFSPASLRSCACHKWEILSPGKMISGLTRVDAEWDAYHQTLHCKSFAKAVSWSISPCPIYPVPWHYFKWSPSSNPPSLQLFSPSSNSQIPEFISEFNGNHWIKGNTDSASRLVLLAGYWCTLVTELLTTSETQD